MRTIELRVNIADETECPNTSVELVACKLRKQENRQITRQICTDDRQYVGRDGQQWTTLEKLRQSGFKNRIEAVDDELYKIITDPSFGMAREL